MNELKMNVSLKDTTPIVCEKCGCEVFVPGVMLRKVSKFLIGSSVDSLMPLEVFMCGNCHHINEMFRPKDPKDSEEQVKS